MNLGIEFFKLLIQVLLIVLVSKYLLISLLRALSKTLNLNAKITGNITGIATSVPELLTVSFSALSGLANASAFNILSSNIINTLQYFTSIILNKNIKILRKKNILIDLILVGITIIIPIIIILLGKENDIWITPVFILLFFVFSKISKINHKKHSENVKCTKSENKENRKNKKIVMVTLQIVGLLAVGLLLFIIGNMLSATLENLCNIFGISQGLIGVILGFMTSMPELITFFESQKHHKKNKNKEAGVVEATSNLLTSNMMNLFIIQTIGITIYFFMF